MAGPPARLSEHDLALALEAIDAGRAADVVARHLDASLRSGLGRVPLALRLLLRGRAIDGASRFDDGGFFLRSRVLTIRLRVGLPERLLASEPAVVLAAFGPWGLLPLHDHPEHLGELLREQAHPPLAPASVPYRGDQHAGEARWPSDADPTVLATLCTEALSLRSGRQCRVLSGPEQVERILETIPERPLAEGGVEVNRTGWRATRAGVVPPALEGNPQTGWELCFFALSDASPLLAVREQPLTFPHHPIYENPLAVVLRAQVNITPSFQVSLVEQESLVSLASFVVVDIQEGRPLVIDGSQRVAPLSREGGW